MKPTLRLNKLIQPGLQLRLTGSFLGLSLLALLFQLALLANTLAHLADRMPNDKELLLQASSGALIRAFALSVAVVLPATFVVGALVTHRVAGPVYRLCQHLRAVREDATHEPCQLRKGDQLQDLCTEVNATVEALRERESEPAEAA